MESHGLVDETAGPRMSPTEFLRGYRAIMASALGVPSNILAMIQADLLQEMEDGSPFPNDLTELERNITIEQLSSASDPLQMTVDFLLKYQDPTVRQILTNIPVGNLLSLDANAACIVGPSGPVVVVNGGLIWMVDLCIGTFLSQLHTGDVGPPQITPESGGMVQLLSHMISYVNGTPCRYEPQVPRTQLKRTLATGISHNALAFVIAHEFGHILLGHLNPSSIRQRHLLDHRGTPVVAAYQHSEEDEFAADAKAFDLLTVNSPLGLEVIHPGVEFVMQFLILLEDLFPSRPCISTHPPASERHHRLSTNWPRELRKDAGFRGRQRNIDGFFEFLQLCAQMVRVLVRDAGIQFADVANVEYIQQRKPAIKINFSRDLSPITYRLGDPGPT